MIKSIKIIGFLFLVTLSFGALGSDFSSMEIFVTQRNEQFREFFDRLNLDMPELRKVADAVEKGDYVKAAFELLSYYDNKKPKAGFELKGGGTGHPDGVIAVADELLQDRLELMRMKGVFERGDSEDIVWNSLAGTDNTQYPGLISRHLHLVDLLAAYKQQPKADYLRVFNSHLWDWLNNNKVTERMKSKGEYSSLGVLDEDVVMDGVFAAVTSPRGLRISDPQWYSLNAAIRLQRWLKLWQNWQGIAINPQVKLLMLISLGEHCDYIRWHHRDMGNWKIGEMHALVETAIVFEEFKDADDWFDYALGELVAEMDAQFYPDGVQKELSFSYNRGIVRDYTDIVDVAQANQLRLPSEILQRLEGFYSYMAQVMSPSGYGTLNNDSDKDYIFTIVSNAARRFESDQIEYIASRGAKGKWKKNSYSTVFPWAGQALFRDGFAADSDFSYFEIGAWGIGHQHNDMLHISVAVGGRDVLVDSGRYTYDGYHDTSNKWRNYFTGSESHNVILIDGLGQSARQREYTSPLSQNDYFITDRFAFARGTFNSGYTGVKDKDKGKFAGKAEHTRNVVYVPQFGWIVIDTIDTDRERRIDALWRFHPDCSVKTDGKSVFTDDTDKGNLRIVPGGEYGFDLSLVKGQQQSVQGWYSEKFNVKVPNTVAVYSGKIEKSSSFVWFLVSDRNTPLLNDGLYDCKWDSDGNTVNISYNSSKGQLRAMVPIRNGKPRVVFNPVSSKAKH